MTPPDIVKQLKKMASLFTQFGNEEPSKFLLYVVDEIERLREDAATWRDAYEAERQDHEATMKAWDEERSGM